jgi:hypothetical protein
MKTKRKLKPIDIDAYIWLSLIDLIDQPGNVMMIEKNGDASIFDGDGNLIRECEKYFWLINTKNRNPQQVPEKLWRKILLTHVTHHCHN